MRVAIYTAIFGGYDLLKNQPLFPNTTYVCFTDTPPPPEYRTVWKVVAVPPQNEHPRLTAKRFKAMPHRFLTGADVTIWIDGSMTIVGSDFVSLCVSSLKKWGIACMRHPFGKCIFQEAEGCFEMEKYQGLPILEQAKSYKDAGYPENNGLAACGIIARDMSRPQLPAIGEQWWNENAAWTYQDQISFPYVLWKNNYWFDTLGIDYFDRSRFVLSDHTRTN